MDTDSEEKNPALSAAAAYDRLVSGATGFLGSMSLSKSVFIGVHPWFNCMDKVKNRRPPYFCSTRLRRNASTS